ncbi:hypothetical protein L9F63_020868, partial [Diploptera punctata]
HLEISKVKSKHIRLPLCENYFEQRVKQRGYLFKGNYVGKTKCNIYVILHGQKKRIHTSGHRQRVSIENGRQVRRTLWRTKSLRYNVIQFRNSLFDEKKYSTTYR